MPRKDQAAAARVAGGDASETVGIETWRQDQAQAAQRKENRLDGFENELKQLIAATTDELNELQSRCESELTALRRAQVQDLHGLLQEKSTIETKMKQAADELSNAYNSMTTELQAAMLGRIQDCMDVQHS